MTLLLKPNKKYSVAFYLYPSNYYLYDEIVYKEAHARFNPFIVKVLKTGLNYRPNQLSGLKRCTMDGKGFFLVKY